MDLTIHFDDFFFLRFKEGDEKAFEKVFKSEYNRIVGFCQQFVGDRHKAQNVAQEAFVKLWLNKEKIDTVNGIRSFLYTASKTGCLNLIRHQKVVSKYSDKQLQAKEGDLFRETLESFNFDVLELTELENLINQSIQELPEKCRLVFTMSRMEGKKNSEIADELSITVKSVEANITRALKTLREKLSEYLPAILVNVIMQNI